MTQGETWGEALTRLSKPTELGISPLYTDYLISLAALIGESARGCLMRPVYKVTLRGSVVQDADDGYDNPTWFQIRDVLYGNDFQRKVGLSVSLNLFIEWLYKRPFPEEMMDKEMMTELAREWILYAEEMTG